MARRRRRGLARVSAAYLAALVAFSGYALLDTFVIERTYAAEAQVTSDKAALATDVVLQDQDASAGADAGAGTQATSQASAETGVELATYRYEDTTVYVVDVYAGDASELRAALAKGTYGKNVTATTSDTAEDVDATVAVNGDYYGARNAGYVVRNGVLYRDVAAASDQEDLVIYADGSFDIVCEGEVTAEELVEAGAWQVFSFGPGLVDDGELIVGATDEVDQAMASNPRTAIGQVGEGHYVLVVSDGRTSESEGLTLAQLAQFMRDELGVTCAYNLDGGGSSTLWYEGEVVNNPTTSGNSVKERKVSDIVYVA